MEPPILDTLVKLASLGASGISIFAIFWIGWLISRTPADAGAERHRTMRLFMAMCLAIAIVSGITSYLNVRLDSQTVDELQAKLATSDKAVQQCKELRASARGTLDTLERVLHSKELAAAESGSGELQRDVETLKGAIEDLKGKL